MECVGTDTGKFDNAVEQMNEVLQHHLSEEEQTILNPARAEVSQKVPASLGLEFIAARSAHLDANAGRIENVRAIVNQARRQGKLRD